MVVGIFGTFIYIVIAYSISTAFYAIIPSSIPLNSIFILILLMITGILYIRQGMSKYGLSKLVILFCLGVWTCFESSNIEQHLSDLINIFSCVFIVTKMGSNENLIAIYKIIKEKKYGIRRFVIVMAIVILIELFLAACYSNKDNWGNSNYFVGFSQTYHVWASCICLIAVLWMVTLEGNDIKIVDIFCLLVFVLSILQTGARVFLVPALIYCFLYYNKCLKNKGIKYILVPIVIVIGFFIILNTSMFDKFVFLSNEGIINKNYSALDTFTSGRTVMWSSYVAAFKSLDIKHKLFGKGFDYIYSLLGHSGHNDLLHSLLGIGIIGSVIYTSAFIKPIKAIKYKEIKREKVNVLIILIYFYIPFLLNGMFGYIHYFLSFLLLCADFANSEEMIRRGKNESNIYM